MKVGYSKAFQKEFRSFSAIKRLIISLFIFCIYRHFDCKSKIIHQYIE